MNTEKVDHCIMNKDCSGPSKLVDTCYGFTNGDKWCCEKCDSYCVVRANVIPSKPK